MAAHRSVNIALLPGETLSFPADLYVVIDALRATTMIATLLDRGAGSVTVMETEEAAREMAASKGAVLAGEVGGVAPPGFHLGNSPVEAMQADLAGQAVVLFTTNGTRALCMTSQLGPAIAGALTNAEAIVERCRVAERVTLVCAGNRAGSAFSIEDFAVAAAITSRLLADEPGRQQNDGVLLAKAALAANAGDVPTMMRRGSHAATLHELGLDADIDFACRRDTTQVVSEVRAFGNGWARLEART